VYAYDEKTYGVEF
jgi:hypothetical protein